MRRPVHAAARRSPSLARVALQVLMASAPLAATVAHADATVPGSGEKRPAKDPVKSGKPVTVEAPTFSGGVIAQPVFVTPPPPNPVQPAKKGKK